jgi:transcriptional regulator with XRE-family HTH domain
MQTDLAKTLRDLRTFRRQKGLSQKILAKRLGVSQSTISRRERKPPQRHSDATFKICRYAVKKNSKVTLVNRRAVQNAIDEVCSKSDAHAIALLEIVETLLELCRSGRGVREEEKLG